MKRSWLALALALVTPLAHAQDDELARARFLDQQGVRAFGEGRFRDAMTLFNESYRANGPATELWNVARCQLKLDDPDAARRTLETYLNQKNLAESDRAEGKRLLDEIEKRVSTFVVASTPAGASVNVDGHAVGMTPYSSTLQPGTHDIRITREGTTVTKHVDAHDGRAVVISVELGPIDHASPRSQSQQKHVRRFSAELGLLGVVSSLGGTAVIEGGPAPELSLGYAPFAYRHALVGFGLRVRLGFDAWSTSAGVSNAIAGCTPPNDFTAVEVLAMPTVFGAYRISRRVSLGARAGIGAAVYASGAPIGGDLFTAACVYGGSLAPDGYAALDVSVRMTDDFRIVLFPATLDVHPGYVNARSDGSLDATGPWFRIGAGFAVAVDL